MALNAAVGAFDTGTGAVTSTVVVSGLGFAPVAVLFWWNGRTGSSTASGRASQQRGFGAATSTTQRWSVASSSQDTPTTMVAKKSQRNDACVGILTALGALDGLLDVQSFDSGGFTLVVDDQFAASYRVHYLALGGADITNAKAGSVALNNVGAGDVDVTDPGFQPDFIALASSGQTSINGTITSDSTIAFAMASGTASANQGVWTAGSNDAAATSVTLTYCRSGEVVAAYNAAVTALSIRGSMTSWLSTGFRLNLTAAGGGGILCYLALKGGKYYVENLLTSLSLNATIAESGFGFTPLGALFVSGCLAEASAGTPVAHDQFSLGAATSASNREAMAVMDQNAAGTAVVSTAVYVDEVYINLSTTGTIEGLADISSFDATGFTLIEDDADTVAAFVFYAAFGSAPATYTQDVAGAATPAGSLQKTAAKPVAGTTTSSGSLSKSAARLLSGASASAGALSKTTSKALAGACASTGALAKTTSKALAGALATLSGALQRTTVKVLAGVVASSGSLSKALARALAGALASAGALQKTVAKVLGGALACTGALSAAAARALSAALASAGALSTTALVACAGALSSAGDCILEVAVSLDGFLTASGALSTISSFGALLAGALGLDGRLSNAPDKQADGAVSPAGTPTSGASSHLAGVLSGAGSLATQFVSGGGQVVQQAVSGVLTLAGSLLAVVERGRPFIPGAGVPWHVWRRGRLADIRPHDRVLSGTATLPAVSVDLRLTATAALGVSGVAVVTVAGPAGVFAAPGSARLSARVQVESTGALVLRTLSTPSEDWLLGLLDDDELVLASGRGAGKEAGR